MIFAILPVKYDIYDVSYFYIYNYMIYHFTYKICKATSSLDRFWPFDAVVDDDVTESSCWHLSWLQPVTLPLDDH